MYTSKQIQTALKNMLPILLESAGFIEVKSNLRCPAPGKANMPDLLVDIQINDKSIYTLALKIKQEGHPRYARMAASELADIADGKKNWYGVFASAFISENSRRICKEKGIGCIDLAGNCFLKFDNFFLSVEGRPNPAPYSRPLKTLFYPRSTRAMRVMLCNPGKEWFLSELADTSDISLGLAHKIKKLMFDSEFAKENHSGGKPKFMLTNPASLLSEWSKNYSYKKNTARNYYSPDSPDIIEKKLADYLKKSSDTYAFTLTSGASRIAPFLRYTRVFVYVKDNIDRAADALNLKKVSSGANVFILEPYDEGIFYGLQEVQNAKVVSDVQLYLDLKSYGERGQEAAEFLYKQRLEKKWVQKTITQNKK